MVKGQRVCSAAGARGRAPREWEGRRTGHQEPGTESSAFVGHMHGHQPGGPPLFLGAEATPPPSELAKG